MKILIATGIYPPEIGGPATVIKELADGLLAAGHEVEVVTYGDEREEKFVRNVPRGGGVLSRYLRMVRAIRKNLIEGTVLLSTDVFSVGIPSRLALVGKKNVFLLRLGGEWWWEDSVEKGRTSLPLRKFWSIPKSNFRDWLAKKNYGWILRRAEKVGVTSEMLGEVLKKIHPDIAGSIRVTPNGLRSEIQPKEYAGLHRPLRLAYVGRFARVKNVPFLAEALKRLNAQSKAVECTFAGDGPMLGETKKILEGVPGMEFIGKTTRTEVERILRLSDALVLPSLSDICPNVVMEALSLGTPAIITSENGLPKDIGGIIELSPTDMDGWVKTLESLGEREKFDNLKASIQLPKNYGLSLFDFVTSI